MTRENYSAWHINAGTYKSDWSDDKKLRFFAKYAVLAPSGHNTQPWRFTFTAREMTLKADPKRKLPYSGIQANEPYVSLGACLGILELAAKGFGCKLEIKYITKNDTAARVRIDGTVAPDPSLLDAITARVSNRNSYETAPLPQRLIKDFVKPEFGGTKTYVLTEKQDISYVADLTKEATITTFTDSEFRKELSKWVRNNLTNRFDGMPGFAQGIPTPVSLFAKHIIKHINVSKDQAKKDSDRVLRSSGLVIVEAKNSSPEALMDAGRVYAHICVCAQQQGIATAGVGAAIIEPETTKRLMKKLGLSGKPIAIIRFGRALKQARHTPRWPLVALVD